MRAVQERVCEEAGACRSLPRRVAADPIGRGIRLDGQLHTTGTGEMSTTRVSSAPTRQVITLSIPEFAMLVRFAVLAELYDQPAAVTREQPQFEMALVSYSSGRRIGDMDCWWPLLRGFAREWIVERRAS